MPIKISDNLPARKFLQSEGLVVMRESDATRQDIRPLKIALLNLMPKKEQTEMHFSRLIGATPLQVELTLVTTGSYTPSNVSKQHMLDFYRPWEDIKDQKFDGMIVTGAPIEKLPFEEVTYWDELSNIYAWTQTNVFNTLNVCWGAQAALQHFYNTPKILLPKKKFGLFNHHITKKHSVLLRGFADEFMVPVSRHTETRIEDLPKDKGLEILATSDEAGVCIIRDHIKRQIYMFNHLEYDATGLQDEYLRDLDQGEDIQLPYNYFPGDNPSAIPLNLWRAHAHLLIGNWITEVYEDTPYNLNEIGTTD